MISSIYVTLSVFCVVSFGILRISDAREVKLEPGKPSVIHVVGPEVVTLTVPGLSPVASHVIFQSHTQWEQLRLSTVRNYTRQTSAVGTSVGVLQLISNRQTQSSSYVSLIQNANVTVKDTRNVTVVVSAWVYSLGKPIPGACNTEFNMEYDPNVAVLDESRLNKVNFMYAATALSSQGQKIKSCESKSQQKKLSYEVYQYFMDERDISEAHFTGAMIDMMNIDRVQKIGRKVKTISYLDGKTKVSFADHKGLGAIYTVIVRETTPRGDTKSALYVTSQTYSCKQGECSQDITTIVIAIIFALVGLFISFVGHRFFRTAMFIFGHFAFFIAFYVLVARFTTWSETATVVTPFCLALFGGIIWVTFWSFCGIPVLSVLLAGLVMGFIISSVLFSYTPLGMISWWSSAFNYGMAFSCGVLLFPVLLLAATRALHIFSCAMVGSYMVVYALDKSLLRGSVQSIVDISLNKATIPDYIEALPTNPIQMTDIILLVAWVLLTAITFTFQWIRERKRPEFPPCPWHERQFRRRREESVRRGAEINTDDEEEPLLAPHRQLQQRAYGNIQPTAPPPPTYQEVQNQQHPNIVRINAPVVEPL